MRTSSLRIASKIGAILGGMNTPLQALQARQAVEKMRHLRNKVQLFTAQARMMNSSSANFDSRLLVDRATSLLKDLGNARLEFLGPRGQTDTLARSLPSRAAGGSGISAAAQWVPELRAAAMQFAVAVREAENAVFQLRDTGLEGLNSPQRTATAPDGLFDIILNFTDLLTRWIERRKLHRP